MRREAAGAALLLAPAWLALLHTLACSSAGPPSARAPRPNVLLVTADSLRADRIDWTPGGRTPALARLAARGTRFTRAFTVTPWTAPSLVSIFTGLYPPTHGVVNRDDTTPKTVPTLPRILAARGYALANFGFFTQVSYYRNLGLPPQAIEGAEVAGSTALAGWLGHAPEPFFAWIHHVEPHLPYGAGGYEAAAAAVRGSSGLERAQTSATVPRGAGLTFAPDDRDRVLALYDRDVVEMDRAIGSVLEALDARGLTGRTLVVFTADHGEELLEHGWVGHASTSGEATLHDEVLRIPLVVAGPGVPAGRVTSALAQNVDVAPTLLALAGERAREMQGVSLVPALGGRAGKRRRLFVSTSVGGHLTPEARRLERLEGVGDGTRVHADRVGAPAAADDPRAPELAPDLARWRREQARARLRFLAAYGGSVRPAEKDVAAYAETLPLRAPAEGPALGWHEAGGTIRLAWDDAEAGPAEGGYWVEYAAGSGLLSARGAFPVEETSIAFGPFPVAFWNDLASYSPFRFRVLEPGGRRRSAWRSFHLERGR
jgi:arylsulfatase A-like enzyme